MPNVSSPQIIGQIDMSQEVIGLADVPFEDLKEVLEAICEHLEIEIVREKTPDYCFYEIASSVVKPLAK